MQIQKNILLALYTTFKIGGPAKFFCVVKDQFDALEAYEFAKANNLEVFVLGGGSNILVSDEGFKGLVIKVECGRWERIYFIKSSFRRKLG
jgi:UDP-N-acetylmuramate dehydrogenase